MYYSDDGVTAALTCCSLGCSRVMLMMTNTFPKISGTIFK